MTAFLGLGASPLPHPASRRQYDYIGGLGGGAGRNRIPQQPANASFVLNAALSILGWEVLANPA
jgi:hypothetical protein